MANSQNPPRQVPKTEEFRITTDTSTQILIIVNSLDDIKWNKDGTPKATTLNANGTPRKPYTKKTQNASAAESSKKRKRPEDPEIQDDSKRRRFSEMPEIPEKKAWEKPSELEDSKTNVIDEGNGKEDEKDENFQQETSSIPSELGDIAIVDKGKGREVEMIKEPEIVEQQACVKPRGLDDNTFLGGNKRKEIEQVEGTEMPLQSPIPQGAPMLQQDDMFQQRYTPQQHYMAQQHHTSQQHYTFRQYHMAQQQPEIFNQHGPFDLPAPSCSPGPSKLPGRPKQSKTNKASKTPEIPEESEELKIPDAPKKRKERTQKKNGEFRALWTPRNPRQPSKSKKAQEFRKSEAPKKPREEIFKDTPTEGPEDFKRYMFIPLETVEVPIGKLPDLWEVLGADKHTGKNGIDAAYDNLLARAEQHQPDIKRDQDQPEKYIKRIKMAYEVLSNEWADSEYTWDFRSNDPNSGHMFHLQGSSHPFEPTTSKPQAPIREQRIPFHAYRYLEGKGYIIQKRFYDKLTKMLYQKLETTSKSAVEALAWTFNPEKEMFEMRWESTGWDKIKDYNPLPESNLYCEAKIEHSLKSNLRESKPLDSQDVEDSPRCDYELVLDNLLYP